MCQCNFRKKHWKSVKISDFGPSLSVESWFCLVSCPPLVWKHDLLRKLQSLSKHFAIASTFLHVSLSLPQLSLSQGLCTNGLLDQCLIKMSISLSLCRELSCSRMWTNTKLVNACNYELWRLSLLKLFCLVACCFILSKFIMNWLYYTFTMNVCGLHLFVASCNYTSILPKILVYKFGWCHDCRIIPQWPNQDI